ncbi:hypothetical protein [Luteolibacter soli]|uniref:Anacyclamide/piricyclamide family prenylated cyclic peptide n=1 Tax=Luteolibacter soli TaxID=3135280 RepID=A0ABU9AYY7_9BACT
MKKKPTSKEGAADQTNAAANTATGDSDRTAVAVRETSAFITPQMASCNYFAGDPTSVDPKDENP